MAQTASAALLFINPAHTAGQDLASDIVLPEDLLEPLCHAVNDDDLYFGAEDVFGYAEDFGFEDEDGEMMFGDDDDAQDGYSPVWVWRKPRHRKG